MGFQGRAFAFDSPAAGVAALIARARWGTPGTSAPRASEAVSLIAARGRILACPVQCDRDSPAFDYAAMDGYAVHAGDVLATATHARAQGDSTITLPVVGEARIGCEPPPLCDPRAGTDGVKPTTPVARALRTATGAPMPPRDAGADADAVIKREDVTEHADTSPIGVSAITLAISIAERVKPGDHVRHRAENACAGMNFARRGEVVTPSSLGALAAVGCVAPRVFTPLRVALITTGDELVPSEATPGPYQVRNSNAVAVAAMLHAQAWLDVVRVTHIPDDADLAGTLRDCLGPTHRIEALILTGGVSMGHRDPVRAAVERETGDIVFHGLPQRPGKPMLAAVLTSPEGATVPLIALPGNPVSAMVTCARVALPVLAAGAGAARTPLNLSPSLVELANDDGKRLDLWWHRPVRLVDDQHGPPRAEIIDTRGSGDIIAAARSDGFVELPPSRALASTSGGIGLVPFYRWPT